MPRADQSPINFYGTYSFDVETELHREGRRPSAHQPPEFPGTRRRDQIHSVTKGPNTAMVAGPIAPICAQNEQNCKCRNKFGTTEMTCQLLATRDERRGVALPRQFTPTCHIGGNAES